MQPPVLALVDPDLDPADKMEEKKNASLRHHA